MDTQRDRLWAHLLVGQEADEEGVGLWRAADHAPVGERTSSTCDDAERLDAGEAAAEVVVGLVTVLLKIHESACDADQFILERSLVQAGVEPRGNRTGGELLRHGLHRAVVECAT